MESALFDGITHIIFDLDGVLVDSEPMWQTVEKEIIENYGLRWDKEVTKKQVGMRLDEAADIMVQEYDLEMDASILEREILDGMLALISTNEVPVMPGADALVRRAHDSGLTLGIASSSPLVYIQEMVKRCDWDAHIIVQVSGYQVERGKPAPDIYLRAAELLDAVPGCCVAFEDSVNGAKAAYDAGLRSVAVPGNGFSRSEFDNITYDVLPSLNEVVAMLSD